MRKITRCPAGILVDGLRAIGHGNLRMIRFDGLLWHDRRWLLDAFGMAATALPPTTFAIEPSTGLLVGVRQVLSPHYDARPAGSSLDLVVIHCISLPPGEFGGPWIDRLFSGSLPFAEHSYFETLRGMRVSAHVLITRSGDITQFVPFTARAWHAGRSSWRGREACNDFSVGIELEGIESAGYAEEQYHTLRALLAALFATYPSLTFENMVAHSDIAPDRKTDPGPSFQWDRIRGNTPLLV